MKKYVPWLGIIAILVLIFGAMDGVSQQAQRNAANYPQIQLAEDAASELNNGAKAQVTGKVDMAHSLAPFIIVYDKQGKLVSGSGYLNDQLPTAPLGILTAANDQDYNAVTWQPAGNVRIAAITVAAKNYYVLSGRSLKEIEANERESLQISFLGGVGSLIVLTAVYLLAFRPSKHVTSK